MIRLMMILVLFATYSVADTIDVEFEYKDTTPEGQPVRYNVYADDHLVCISTAAEVDLLTCDTGDLKPGTYRWTMDVVRADGNLSGVSPVFLWTLAADAVAPLGFIRVTRLP